MEKEKILKTLREVISEVFETMFFLFPELVESEDDLPPMPEVYFKASIRFNGNNWYLILAGSEKLAEIMARNFLAQGEPVDDAEIADVFREAINVIAGNFLTKLNKNRDRTFIGIPEVEKCKVLSVEDTVGDLWELSFNVDDEFCRVWIKGMNA